MANYTFLEALLDPDLMIGFDATRDQLTVVGISAAGIHVTRGVTTTTLTFQAGSVILPIAPEQLADGGNIVFSDGSLLKIGDDSPTTGDDPLDNQIIDDAATNDQFHGLAGADSFLAGSGNDLVYGNQGADSIHGGDGRDTLYGGQGADWIGNQAGAALVYGNLGADTVASGFDADTVYGGQGNDLIDGGGGEDWLFGNLGADTLIGGSGADRFIFRRVTAEVDVIEDFSRGEDKITITYRGFHVARADNTNFVNTISDNSAVSANTRFIYNQAADILYYDPDGTGVTQATPIAYFMGGIDDMTASDIEIIGVSRALTGSTSADTLIGESGSDTIRGLAGKDLIIGDAGNDILHGGVGADTILGGPGMDVLLYTDHGGPVSVNLELGTADDGAGGLDQLSGIEQVFGSAFDDTLQGDANLFYTLFNGKVSYNGGLQLYGMDGDDSLKAGYGWLLNGGNGNDTVHATGGDNALFGGNGADSLLSGNGRDTLKGGSGDDTIVAGGGNDQLFGRLGSDLLLGGGGDDLIQGDSADGVFDHADDTLVGGLGNDTLMGGDGAATPWGGDVAAYRDAAEGLTLTITQGSVATSRGDTDLLSGMEGIQGGNFNDTISGDGDYWRDGGGGNDFILGGTRPDSLRGGSGADTLNGAGDNDHILGDAGPDHLLGANGDDVLSGGLGQDKLFGDAGRDTLLGEGGDDILSGGNDSEFDSLSGGTGNDTLNGGGGGDYMHGDAGNDRLIGDTGNDTLYAGSGLDVLMGGLGNDALSGDEFTLATDPNANGPMIINNNVMDGGAGDDLLVVGHTSGGGGADTLTGGDGLDDFLIRLDRDISGAKWFNNIAHITDFTQGADRLLLERSSQAADISLVDGVNFITIADAFDGTNAGADPVFVYSQTTDILYYAPGTPDTTGPLVLAVFDNDIDLRAEDVWLTP